MTILRSWNGRRAKYTSCVPSQVKCFIVRSTHPRIVTLISCTNGSHTVIHPKQIVDSFMSTRKQGIPGPKLGNPSEEALAKDWGFWFDTSFERIYFWLGPHATRRKASPAQSRAAFSSSSSKQRAFIQLCIKCPVTNVSNRRRVVHVYEYTHSSVTVWLYDRSTTSLHQIYLTYVASTSFHSLPSLPEGLAHRRLLNRQWRLNEIHDEDTRYRYGSGRYVSSSHVRCLESVYSCVCARYGTNVRPELCRHRWWQH